MPDHLTTEYFAERLGRSRINLAGVVFARLSRPPDPASRPGAFKLGPAEADDLAPIFLVPIAADDQGRYYEAIFNLAHCRRGPCFEIGNVIIEP